MKQRTTRLLATLTLAIALTTGLAAPAFALATGPTGGTTVNPTPTTTTTPPTTTSTDNCPAAKGDTSQQQVLSGADQAQSDCGVGVTNLASSVVDILSIVVGIAAVIMIIVAGLKYITSNGDAGSVSSAKTTLIYALIGVAIAAIAQLLVHIVLAGTNNV